MSLLENGSLLKFTSDKVKGFEVKRITSVSGIYVVDKNGYIGIKINDYFSQNGSPYPGNYALVAKGPDYSNLGLGQVTFLEDAIGSVTIGDKTYRTVIMPDGKEWMAENLDFCPEGIKFRDGTNGNIWSNYSREAQATYYKYDEVTYGWAGKKYGLIYNGYAAMALTIAGWHLPTRDDWYALKNSVKSSGTRLKSTTEWSSGNGTDIYGFTAYPAGWWVNNAFNDITNKCSFWESPISSNYMYHFDLVARNGSIDESSIDSIVGCSIRLVRDTVA